MKRILWIIYKWIGKGYTQISMGRCLHKGKGALLSFCDGHSISGKGNLVEVGDGSQLYHCTFIVSGNNNQIKFGNKCRFSKDTFWISGDNNTIEFGEGTTSAHQNQFAALEGTKIVVGKDCMFSHNILVRTSDSHSIVDHRGKRINYPKDITIGNHCWIGLQCLVMKGASLADNSVLAARSTLNKKYEEPGCIVGGCPAVVLKNNVNWDRNKL